MFETIASTVERGYERAKWVSWSTSSATCEACGENVGSMPWWDKQKLVMRECKQYQESFCDRQIYLQDLRDCNKTLNDVQIITWAIVKACTENRSKSTGNWSRVSFTSLSVYIRSCSKLVHTIGHFFKFSIKQHWTLRKNPTIEMPFSIISWTFYSCSQANLL